MAKHKYIRQDAAIDAVDVCNLHRGIIDALQAIISDIPTADVRPVVRGEWVEDDYGFIHCSFCGMEWEDPEHPKTNFCPLCGADMREIEP